MLPGSVAWFAHGQNDLPEGERAMTAADLRCGYTNEPLGIDEPAPRLTWSWRSAERGARQTAYQVLVARSPGQLMPGAADLWDSGRVDGGRTAVSYGGAPLASRMRCFWSVRGWDEHGTATAFSAPASFETGLLSRDEWHGRWIAGPEGVSSPLLRRELTLPGSVRRARCYLSGLGYHELSCNGARVGDHFLDPATSYYHNDQPFPLGSRVLYVTHDLTALLRSGANALGVMLGHGWYSAEADVPPSPDHREPYGPRPCLLLQLHVELADGRRVAVASDQRWRTASGPIVYNDYTHGETYDARRERPGWDDAPYDDDRWAAASEVPGPGGRLVAQPLPPIRVMETRAPQRMLEPRPGVFVFDLGQNCCGWSRLRARGPRGTEIALAHAARVHEDGSLDPRSNLHHAAAMHGARQTDRYILRGDPAGEEWEPRFTLHGSRFVEVTGYPGTPALDAVDGRGVRTSAPATGRFTCSDELLNRIHAMCWWTFASSMQGYPQDAADRSERVGWLGDPIPEDYLYNFDCASFWAKWADDIADAQKENGHVPVISPLHWRRTYDAYAYPAPVWSSTYAALVWTLYWFLDDEALLDRHYDGLARLVAWLGSLAEEHVIEPGLGDHMEPQPDGSTSSSPRHTPTALTSTAIWYWDVRTLGRIAAILGRGGDAARYAELAERIAAAFNRRFLDPERGTYASGSQTADAVALQMGLVPAEAVERVLDHLLHDVTVRHEGRLSTGMVGTNALVYALPRHGAAEMMYRIATQTTFPSWGFMLERDATTLWEAWSDDRDEQLSLNMKLLGSVDKFFYRDVAGIRPLAPGFRRIAVAPRVVGPVRHASASIETVRGPAAVSWRMLDDGALRLTAEIPANASAEIRLPTGGRPGVRVTEGRRPVWRRGAYVPGAPGVTDARAEDDCVVVEAGSGSFELVLTGGGSSA
ncbi:MAG: family 78 glycoside hydrolase catalytic domain, partial [Spirochaetaceae bacterium]|nr:family 78 glycoside hydrolase catalytic domain [Spirochaetaceae bacterium]